MHLSSTYLNNVAALPCEMQNSLNRSKLLLKLDGFEKQPANNHIIFALYSAAGKIEILLSYTATVIFLISVSVLKTTELDDIRQVSPLSC